MEQKKKETIIKMMLYHIERVECTRYPVEAYPWNRFWCISIMVHLNDLVGRYYPQFKYKVNDFFNYYKDLLNEYYEKSDRKRNFYLKLTGFFMLFIFFSISSMVLLSVHFPFLGFAVTFPSLIFGVLLIIIFIRSEFKKAGNQVSPYIDPEIKETVQELINYLKRFFKENNIDPSNYPLHLRHNDYEGLRYEKRGENNYTAYIVIE